MDTERILDQYRSPRVLDAERELADNPWSPNPEAPKRPLQPHEPARANLRATLPKGDPIAETLASYTVGPAGLPAAFYGLGREGSELLHNLWNRDWGGAAGNAGWMSAGFVGPKGVRNLEKAGLRHKDDWGGTERLRAAQDAAKGRREVTEWQDVGKELPLFSSAGLEAPSTKARQVTSYEKADKQGPETFWPAHGWTPPKTWGTWDRKPAGEWSTWVPVEDLSPGKPTKKWKDQTIWEGDLHNVFQNNDALQNLLAIDPTLGRLRTILGTNPQLKHDGTGGVAWENRAVPFDSPVQMHANGPSMDKMLRNASHETQHLLSGRTGVTPLYAGDDVAFTKPMFGTRAEALFRALWEKEPMASNRSDEMASILDRIPGFSRYLSTPWEKVARETEVRRGMPMDEQARTIPGITIDSYSEAAKPDFHLQKAYGIPLSALRDPKDKR